MLAHPEMITAMIKSNKVFSYYMFDLFELTKAPTIVLRLEDRKFIRSTGLYSLVVDRH